MALLILIIKAAVFLMLTTFAYLSTDYDPTTPTNDNKQFNIYCEITLFNKK